jgi:hypothetical protein
MHSTEVMLRRKRGRPHRRHLVRTLAALVTLAAAAACVERTAGGDGSLPDPRESPNRTHPPHDRSWIAPGWKLLFRIGGSASDTALFDPLWLAADPSGAYVYDRGRPAVLAFDTAGRLRWRYGESGSGPDGFRNVRDLKLDTAGRIWVLDNQNARITVLAPDGTVQRRITSAALSFLDKLTPLGDTAFVAYGVAPLPRLQAMSVSLFHGDGRTARELRLPWPDYSRLPPLAGQLTSSAADSAGEFALAFTVGNGFFVFRNAEPYPYHGLYVEHTPFSQTVRRARESGSRTALQTTVVGEPVSSALSVQLSGGRLYVHFGGRSRDYGRVVDVYDARTGAYLHTLRLPRYFRSLALVPNRSRLYGLHGDTAPTLEAWEGPLPATSTADPDAPNPDR